MDLEDMVEDAREVVADYFRMPTTHFEVTWSFDPRKEQTADPFNEVLIRDQQIILAQNPFHNSYFLYVEILKAITADTLEEAIHNPRSRWNMATLIALLLIPTTQMSKSKKTQYLKRWEQLTQELEPKYRRYNYYRWYNILISIGRKAGIELIQEFIETLEDEKHVENKLNHFLHQYVTSYFKEDDLILLTAALQAQTLEVSVLEELTHFNSQKIYRLLNRLNLHLDEYFLPVYGNYGLVHTLFYTQDHDIVHQLQSNEYFGNLEHFKDNDRTIAKIWLPVNQVDYLMANQLDPELRVFLEIPGSKKLIMWPLLYDANRKEWTQTTDHPPVTVDFAFESSDRKPTKKELQVLKLVVQQGSLNPKSLSLHQSQTQTKRILTQLKRNHLYQTKVLWRYPSDLQSITLYLPLAVWINYQGYQSILATLDDLPDLTELYPDLFDQQYPFMATAIGIEFHTNFNQYRLGYVVRIAAPPTLIISVLEMYREYLLGIHTFNPGSAIGIPVKNYSNGKWQFDRSTLTSMLE